VLGSSKLSAQEWSQGRHTVGVAQAVEAQSAGEKPRIARQRLHVPLGSLAKVEEHFEMGRSIFFLLSCRHGQPPICKWSAVAWLRAAQQFLAVISTMDNLQPASGQG